MQTTESINNTFLAGVFEPEAHIDIKGKRYVITRHFDKSRNLEDAIYEAVKNEAERLEENE